MRVKDFKAKRRRSTESAFEHTFAAYLDDIGIYSRHMSDALAGLPDRYVQGGRWIEFKSIFRARGGWTVGDQLSPEQVRQMAILDQAGDLVYYCALCQDGKRDWVVLMPWAAIKEHGIGKPVPEEFITPRSEVHLLIKRKFA